MARYKRASNFPSRGKPPVAASINGGGEVVPYEAADGGVRLDVRLEQETVWLTQRQMATLFETTPENVLMHLKNVYGEGELIERGTTKDFLAVRTEGRRRVQRGQPLYPTVQVRAAHLLYFIIKDHPFSDGNKRIGSLLFLEYLRRNRLLFRPNGEPRVGENAMVALALLVAESNPNQKDLMIRLILNLLSSEGP